MLTASLGILLRPLPADSDGVLLVVLVVLCTFVVEGVVLDNLCMSRYHDTVLEEITDRIRRRQKRLDGKQDGPDLESRRPLVFQDVEAYPAELVYRPEGPKELDSGPFTDSS